MTVLAISLYLLGIVGAFASVPRDEAPSIRKGIVAILWPVIVAWAIVTGLCGPLLGKFRR